MQNVHLLNSELEGVWNSTRPGWDAGGGEEGAPGNENSCCDAGGLSAIS